MKSGPIRFGQIVEILPKSDSGIGYPSLYIVCLIIGLSPVHKWHYYFETTMAQHSLFVLEVPLNTKKPSERDHDE